MYENYYNLKDNLIYREEMMQNREQLENLIANELKIILDHSQTLSYENKQSIAAEYREWIFGISQSEDLIVIDTRSLS